MRLYTYAYQGKTGVGAERDGALVPLPFADMLTLIRGGQPALAEARKKLKSAPARVAVPLTKAKLRAPIPRPGKMLYSGVNYYSHADDPNQRKPPFLNPRCFSKLPSVVIGPNEPIMHPGLEQNVDWEVELAVVIGRTMKDWPDDKTMRGVFGYTIAHDVSARTTQFQDNQETQGKNLDTFAPMGPCIVTADEIPDPSELRVQLYVNGKKVQDETNKEWIYPLTRVLGHLNSLMTLEPGDIVTTGTPGGVGLHMNPPRYLKPGDVCRLVIEPIGELVNPVKAKVVKTK
jgi:2-keto-4-pentenoate hydratase/2-oxohepta-3-ene-1,7-dioic acid hydratase in catechol pathway